MFLVTKDRIRSMALVHEKIYRSKDFARIDFVDYVRNLVSQMIRSHGTPAESVRAEVRGDPVFLNISTAVPCSLIINELVSNALKHAFPDGRAGRLTIEVGPREDGAFSLIVSDDGVGLPEGFDITVTDSLGLQIVVLLVEQLNGSLDVDGREGTRYAIAFREAREKSVPPPEAV